MDANTRRAEPLARLELDGGWSLWLRRGDLPFRIGRAHDNDLMVASYGVSRRHCTLELHGERLCVVDADSKNGTVAGDRLLRAKRLPLLQPTAILLGDSILRVTPCDAAGAPLAASASARPASRTKTHGVCLVDICESTAMDPADIAKILPALKMAIIGQRPNRVLLLKHTGDGYLAVLTSPTSALAAARRLLRLRLGAQPPLGAPIRVTLTAGPTFATPDRERLGMAISQAVRIEKTLPADMARPGRHVAALKLKDRILMSAEARAALRPPSRRRCLLVGERQLKGFGATLHAVYQYRNEPM